MSPGLFQSLILPAFLEIPPSQTLKFGIHTIALQNLKKTYANDGHALQQITAKFTYKGSSASSIITVHIYITTSLILSQGKDSAPFTIHCIVPFICSHAPAIYDQADLINDAILAISTTCSHCEETFHGKQKRFSSCPNCVGKIHPKCRPNCNTPKPTDDYPRKRKKSTPPMTPPRNKKLVTSPQPHTPHDLPYINPPSPTCISVSVSLPYHPSYPNMPALIPTSIICPNTSSLLPRAFDLPAVTFSPSPTHLPTTTHLLPPIDNISPVLPIPPPLPDTPAQLDNVLASPISPPVLSPPLVTLPLSPLTPCPTVPTLPPQADTPSPLPSILHNTLVPPPPTQPNPSL